MTAHGPTIAGHSDSSVKLEFYGLYKQATKGDVNTGKFRSACGWMQQCDMSRLPLHAEAPSMLSFVDRAKWDAWNAVKGA